MTEKFWRLKQPEYDTDYHTLYINGHLEHPYGLPGVKCASCGETWGGSRILPYPCPLDVRHKLGSRWPISDIAHKELRGKVKKR